MTNPQIGTSSNRRNISDYDEDMRRAKSLGIDAFALNIGVDKDTTQQLELAYASAEKHSMKVFISFDFNWWQTDQAVEIGEMIARFAPRPAQLIVDNKVFASTFAGDGLDVSALRAAVGTTLFFAPNFDPGLDLNVSSVEGLFNWQAWPHNGRNKAPTAHSNISVGEGDQLYINTLAGRAYIAREYSNPPAPGRFDVPCADRPKAVSPWFFTHFGPEVSYSKNWIFPADLLWYDRWREILAMQPRFVEIVTWNDYGESHYTGSLHAPHTDNGASKWVNDMYQVPPARSYRVLMLIGPMTDGQRWLSHSLRHSRQGHLPPTITSQNRTGSSIGIAPRCAAKIATPPIHVW